MCLLQIVNAYLTMTSQASDTINVMDVFFYLNLENKKSTAKWMKEDTFSKDKVLVPVVHHNHWSLVVSDSNSFAGFNLSNELFRFSI